MSDVRWSVAISELRSRWAGLDRDWQSVGAVVVVLTVAFDGWIP